VTRAPDAVIFDMDGVLVDSGAHHRAAWASLCAELSLSPPREFWRLTIGRPAEEAVGLLVGGVSTSEAVRLAERKRAHYAAHARRGIVPVAGVCAYVAALAERGIPRAIATSAARRDVERLLGAIGLHDAFDATVSAEDVRWGKPNPEVYLKAAAAVGVAPARCLVFEDAVVGVQAAREAGMRVIGVATSYTGDELTAAGAERFITDFEGLPWPP
jgi:HAD superfamily hydrolase (TIGR01509 family)